MLEPASPAAPATVIHDPAPPQRLNARERRWLRLTDLAFLLCALAALARPALSPLLCLGLVAALTGAWLLAIAGGS